LVGQDHLFYDSSIDDWVKAKNLTDRSFLVDCGKNKHQCLGVESLDQEAKAYEVSLKNPNTFFIYKSQILVHNVAPVFALAGAAAASTAGTVGTGSATGGVFGLFCGGAIVWLGFGGKIKRVCNFFFKTNAAGKAIKQAARAAARFAGKNSGKVFDSAGNLIGYFCNKTGNYVSCGTSVVKTVAKASVGAVASVSKVATQAVGTAVVSTAKVATQAVGTAVVGAAKIGTQAVGTAVVGAAKIGTQAVGVAAVGAAKVGFKAAGLVTGGVSTIGALAIKTGSSAIKIGSAKTVKAVDIAVRFVIEAANRGLFNVFNIGRGSNFGGQTGKAGGGIAAHFGDGLRGVGKTFGDFFQKPFVRNTAKVFVGGAAVAGVIYFGGANTYWVPSVEDSTANLRKNNNVTKPKQTNIENTGGSQSGSGNPDPNGNDPKNDKDGKKERVISKVTETEFFHRPEIKSDYGYYKDDVYMRKHRRNGLFKKAEYLEFDHTHNEVEVYNWSGDHLGAYDPVSNKMYKPAEKGRNIFKRK
jgi:hypothetical protein